MTNGYELLIEKETMFAEMLMQVLRDNAIPCVAMPTQGAGFVLKTGLQDRLNVYVPADQLEQAKFLVQELFSGDFSDEEVSEDIAQ